ncbi:Protein LIKE COV 3 [Linum perenne]
MPPPTAADPIPPPPPLPPSSPAKSFVGTGVFEACPELGLEKVHHRKQISRSADYCSVILLPIAITFCVTWWFIRFVDSFFSPIYALLGIDVFGLGFVTSLSFIFLVGVFMSSWLGASVLSLGEWFINKMPFVSYIYSASKQISTAISPDQNSHAFKEVAIIRHPRNGEYAFGFITSTVLLRGNLTTEELCCVYVPTNHLYLGDIYLISSKDVMRPNLSVREGIEIVISGGMSIPQILTTLEEQEPDEAKLGKYGVPPV